MSVHIVRFANDGVCQVDASYTPASMSAPGCSRRVGVGKGGMQQVLLSGVGDSARWQCSGGCDGGVERRAGQRTIGATCYSRPRGGSSR